VSLGIVEVNELRDRVATALGALPAPWRESPYAPGVLPDLDGRELHRTWSVLVTDSDVREHRKVRSEAGDDAVLVRSLIVVHWTHALTSDDPRTDYRDALSDEAAVLAAVRAADETDIAAYVLQGVRRRSLVDGGVHSTLATWFVDHFVSV
jgi:hypothetical protein